MLLFRTIGILMALAIKVQYSFLNVTKRNWFLKFRFEPNWLSVIAWRRVSRSVHSNLKDRLPPVHWCSSSRYSQSDRSSLAFCAVFGESVLVQPITPCAYGLRTCLGDRDSCYNLQHYRSSLQPPPFSITLAHKYLVDCTCLACPSGPMVSHFSISIFLLICDVGLPHCQFSLPSGNRASWQKAMETSGLKSV